MPSLVTAKRKPKRELVEAAVSDVVTAGDAPLEDQVRDLPLNECRRDLQRVVNLQEIGQNQLAKKTSPTRQLFEFSAFRFYPVEAVKLLRSLTLRPVPCPLLAVQRGRDGQECPSYEKFTAVKLLFKSECSLRGKNGDYDITHFSDIGHSLCDFSWVHTSVDRPVSVSKTGFQLLSNQCFDRISDYRALD